MVLLDDLHAWNDACAADGADAQALRERGRELAIRVQGELGTDGWEVLYRMDGRMLRAHPALWNVHQGPLPADVNISGES